MFPLHPPLMNLETWEAREAPPATKQKKLGIRQRWVPWEGGAVDRGSII